MSRPIHPSLALAVLAEMAQAQGLDLNENQRSPEFLALFARAMTKVGLRPPVAWGVRPGHPPSVNSFDKMDGARVQ